MVTGMFPRESESLEKNLELAYLSEERLKFEENSPEYTLEIGNFDRVI